MEQDRPVRRPWRWPGDARIVVSVGLAFEAFEQRSQFITSASGAGANCFSLSYGDYGWKAGAWRLIELLEQAGIVAPSEGGPSRRVLHQSESGIQSLD